MDEKLSSFEFNEFKEKLFNSYDLLKDLSTDPSVSYNSALYGFLCLSVHAVSSAISHLGEFRGIDE